MEKDRRCLCSVAEYIAAPRYHILCTQGHHRKGNTQDSGNSEGNRDNVGQTAAEGVRIRSGDAPRCADLKHQVQALRQNQKQPLEHGHSCWLGSTFWSIERVQNQEKRKGKESFK
jgi:hypothetical protein